MNNHAFRMNVEGAFLRRTDFSRANLQGANLARADFKGASFVGADLKDAVLDGTNLSGADLTGARNLTAAQLRTAIVDRTTRLPAYISVEELG